MREYRKSKAAEPDFKAAWLITLTDLMTLMLTFFVTLVALSVFDEESKQRVMDSVSTVFATVPGTESAFPDTRLDPRKAGGLEAERDRRIEEIKRQLLETDSEVRISQNSRFLMISINADILFKQGGSSLTAEGGAVLDQMVPLLLSGRVPMLVAGHSAPLLEEEGLAVHADPDATGMNLGWMLSMDRALSVYRHYIGRGANPAWMFMEGYGEYKPRFSNDDPGGRRKNRRVDLVLDKRNMSFGAAADKPGREDWRSGDFYFRDFRFDLGYPNMNERPRIGGEMFAPGGAPAAVTEGGS